METGIKKGLSARGRVGCSVDLVERKSYSIFAAISNALLFLDFTILNCCLLHY